MSLPLSGPMSASAINVELGRASNAAFDINGAAERALAGVPSGAISMSDFYGKSVFSVTKTDLQTQTGVGLTADFTCNLGQVANQRRLFALLSWHKDSGTTVAVLSSATIDGVAATIHISVTDSNPNTGGHTLGAAIISAETGTNASGIVHCVWTGAGAGSVACGVIRTTGLVGGSPTATASNKGPGHQDLTINCPALGVVMACVGAGTESGSPDAGISNPTGTESYDGSYYAGVAVKGQASNPSYPVTTTLSGPGAGMGTVALTWVGQ